MKKPVRTVVVLVLAVVMAAIMAAILFICAGRTDLPMLWAYCGVYAVLAVWMGMSIDLGLLKERLRPGVGGRDRWLVVVGKLLGSAHLIIAGLDVGRYHWSDTVPLAVQIVGLAGFTATFGFTIWAMTVNRFFSPVVRIQEERGHHLITAGPYQYVRHPGYAGLLIGLPCSALALGSWVSGVPILMLCLFILRRTVLEDRFLLENLEGYEAYAETIPYRLVPGVW